MGGGQPPPDPCSYTYVNPGVIQTYHIIIKISLCYV